MTVLGSFYLLCVPSPPMQTGKKKRILQQIEQGFLHPLAMTPTGVRRAVGHRGNRFLTERVFRQYLHAWSSSEGVVGFCCCCFPSCAWGMAENLLRVAE